MVLCCLHGALLSNRACECKLFHPLSPSDNISQTLTAHSHWTTPQRLAQLLFLTFSCPISRPWQLKCGCCVAVCITKVRRSSWPPKTAIVLILSSEAHHWMSAKRLDSVKRLVQMLQKSTCGSWSCAQPVHRLVHSAGSQACTQPVHRLVPSRFTGLHSGDSRSLSRMTRRTGPPPAAGMRQRSCEVHPPAAGLCCPPRSACSPTAPR